MGHMQGSLLHLTAGGEGTSPCDTMQTACVRSMHGTGRR